MTGQVLGRATDANDGEARYGPREMLGREAPT